jgi:hypothetical protein
VTTKPWGRQARPITDITSTALGKEGNGGTPVDPLLGSDQDISIYTTAVPK